jgi:hypothetical protein
VIVDVRGRVEGVRERNVVVGKKNARMREARDWQTGNSSVQFSTSDRQTLQADGSRRGMPLFAATGSPLPAYTASNGLRRPSK